VVSYVIAGALSLAPFATKAAHPNPPYPRLDGPLEISGGQYAPVTWSDIPGWADDDHLLALKAFRASCVAILSQTASSNDSKALGVSLRAMPRRQGNGQGGETFP